MLALGSTSANARPDRVHSDRDRAEAAPPHELGLLRSRTSLTNLESSLDASGMLRQRALEQLSEIGTPEALQVIARWLEPSPSLTASDWLHVARALAPHAKQVTARKWLGRILTGLSPLESGATTPPERAIERWARGTAALSLARAGDVASLELLGNALRQSPQQAELASNALEAHPPQTLDPLLHARGAPSVALIATLERLGDQRTYPALREFVRRGTAELQARAALALFRLGHLEILAVARHWLESAPGHLELLRSATEILLGAEQPESVTAFERLLASDAAAALALAPRHPNPSLAVALDTRFDRLPAELRQQAIEVLGGQGGPVALARLERTLVVPHLADAAALALAHSPDAAAAAVLRQAAQRESSSLRALAVRAWVMRSWVRGEHGGHGEHRTELAALLSRLEQNDDPALRWLGAWGRAVMFEDLAVNALSQDDWIVAGSAAATVLIHSPRLAEAACSRLRLAKTARVRAALAAGLVDHAAARGVSTTTLHHLLDEFPELERTVAPLITSRGDPLRPSAADAWLGGSDPLLRMAALRGLGRRGAEELGVLWRSYQSEADPAVRRSVIEGLVEGLSALPPTPLRARYFDWIRDFEPDPETRRRARLGAAGAPATSARGSRATWLRLENAEPGSLVVITTDEGHTFPALVPPDRVVPLLGFSDRAFSVQAQASKSRTNTPLEERTPLGS